MEYFNVFETLVAKISAANELFNQDYPESNQNHFFNDKIPENSKIYHNIYQEYKNKKMSDRELKRPWNKLSANYKITVVLNFLKDFEKLHPNINLNLIRYELLLNIDSNKGLDLKMDYDSQVGRLNKIYGYKLEENKIIKNDNLDDYISNKIKLKLRLKANNNE